MSTECPFCNLYERIIIENTNAVAILSNPRKVAGHYLVIPKRHIEKPWKLSEEEMLDIFRIITLIQKKIASEITDGSDVLEHFRPFIPQGKIKVNHIHYHILPRAFNDEIYQTLEKHETEDIYTPLNSEERKKFESLLLND